MPTKKNIIPIQDFNQGGLAHSKWSGAKNTLYKFIGFDPHSQPGILNVEQKLKNFSGSIVDEFCKVGVNTSVGSQLLFSSVSGKIWERTENGKLRLVHTTSSSASHSPSLSPSISPSTSPSASLSPSASPSLSPSISPSVSPSGSVSPSASPSLSPSISPSVSPSSSSSPSTSLSPSLSPSISPSISPSPSPAADTSACLGAAEYRGRVWWFTRYAAHYIAVEDIVNNDWANDAVENAELFDNGDPDYHPTQEVNQVLYIGDGNLVAQIDGTTFSPDALDIKDPLRVKSLGTIATDLLVGTFVSDNVTKTEIIRWNTWSVSFTNSDPIPEVGINAFLPTDNFVLVNAGKAGNLYYYDGENLEPYLKIPGTYSPTATAEVYPYSVANKEGQILFGLSNISGNPADQLVYRIARHSRDFDHIMDQPYPISARDGDDFVLSGLEIGSILVVGQLILVCWKNASNPGVVDILDVDNKLNGAYFETRVMSDDREELSNLEKIVVPYASIPANTDIDMYLDRNYVGYGTALDKIKDTDRNIVESNSEEQDFTTLQLKVKVTTSGNNAPQIESAGVFLK